MKFFYSFSIASSILLGVQSVAGLPKSKSTHIPANGLIKSTGSTGASYPKPAVPIGAAGGSFAKVDGRLFQIDSKTQYFAGANAWWLGHLLDNANVDKVFSELASSQLKVARIWGFGNTNEATSTGGIPRLDYVVSAAEKHGLKLVMVLLNNWDPLGGINTYTKAFGGTATSFYTDKASQAAYKGYIKMIVNRYKSSPAVFAWELCNEPRCTNCATSVITNWASDISAYIKSIDSNHLVTLGDEGWLPGQGDGSYAYSGSEGVDFTKNLAIPTIDYGVFHLYTQQWGYNDTWGNEWVMQHDAVGKAAGKPVVFEEYGSTNTSNHQAAMTPWQEVSLKQSSMAYDAFWQFATQLSAIDGSPFDDYAIYYDSKPGSDYQVLANQHAAAMLAKQPVAH